MFSSRHSALNSFPIDTVAQALAWARHALVGTSDSAGLDAQVLLAHVLGTDRAALLAHPERILTPEQAAAYRALVERGAAGVPLPYLTGHQAFYDLDLIVTLEVLIPRPETEHLIEAALAWAHKQSPLSTSAAPWGGDLGVGLRIVDVGTGSGAIAVTLAKHLPGARVCAIDLSAAALEVARQNAARYDLEQRIEWKVGDLLTPLVEEGRQVDLIAANLPYIVHKDLASLAVARHEPQLALDGGSDGLDLIRRLLVQAPRVLAEDGLLLLEIGAGQGEQVCDLARAALPGAQARILFDYAGLDRVVSIERGN
jgi:release factor glutamine methyltransferase